MIDSGQRHPDRCASAAAVQRPSPRRSPYTAQQRVPWRGLGAAVRAHSERARSWTPRRDLDSEDGGEHPRTHASRRDRAAARPAPRRGQRHPRTQSHGAPAGEVQAAVRDGLTEGRRVLERERSTGGTRREVYTTRDYSTPRRSPAAAGADRRPLRKQRLGFVAALRAEPAPEPRCVATA